jgi:hypothetical protein
MTTGRLVNHRGPSSGHQTDLGNQAQKFRDRTTNNQEKSNPRHQQQASSTATARHPKNHAEQRSPQHRHIRESNASSIYFPVQWASATDPLQIKIRTKPRHPKQITATQRYPEPRTHKSRQQPRPEISEKQAPTTLIATVSTFFEKTNEGFDTRTTKQATTKHIQPGTQNSLPAP